MRMRQHLDHVADPVASQEAWYSALSSAGWRAMPWRSGTTGEALARQWRGCSGS